jgi:hypothetical protein
MRRPRRHALQGRWMREGRRQEQKWSSSNGLRIVIWPVSCISKFPQLLHPIGLIFGKFTVASWPLRSYVPARRYAQVSAEPR